MPILEDVATLKFSDLGVQIWETQSVKRFFHLSISTLKDSIRNLLRQCADDELEGQNIQNLLQNTAFLYAPPKFTT